MQRRFRLPALFAALALLAAACGGGEGEEGGNGGNGATGDEAAANAECPWRELENADGPVNITVWYAFLGLPARSMETLTKRYNDSQDKVRVTLAGQGDYDEQLAKYKNLLATPDQLPSIMTAEDTNTRFLYDSQSIVPAQACLEADPEGAKVFDDLLPAVRAAYSVNGRLLAGGFGISNPVLYYNRTHFEAAEITEAPTTLDELRATAEKIKAANISGVAQPLVMPMDSWYLEHWLTGIGEEVVNENNGRNDTLPTEAYADTEQMKELVTWVQDMVRDGLLAAIPQNDTISPYLQVATEAGSMLITTSAAIATVDAAIKGTLSTDVLPQAEGLPLEDFKFESLRVGVAPMPGIEAAGKGQIGGNAWYIVKKANPAEQAAAWDFLKWINSTDNQVEWTIQGGYLPSHSEAAEDPRMEAEFSGSEKGAWLQTAFESITSLDPEFPGPVIGPYAGFRNVLRDVMAKAGEGKFTDADLDAANQRLNDALAQYNRAPGDA